MLIMSYIGDQVWLMTSRQTLPDLRFMDDQLQSLLAKPDMPAVRLCWRFLQFIDVWVEDPVHEAYAGALVGILVWQLNVDLPQPAFERRLGGPFEADIEFLPSEVSVCGREGKYAAQAGGGRRWRVAAALTLRHHVSMGVLTAGAKCGRADVLLSLTRVTS